MALDFEIVDADTPLDELYANFVHSLKGDCGGMHLVPIHECTDAMIDIVSKRMTSSRTNHA
jgi:hypothetical protein